MASGSGVERNALAASGTAGTQAQNAYGTVSPIYSELATGTVGYTPQQKAQMQTAVSQGLGGGVAAATGQGALQAARTGNAGGLDTVIDDAARGAMQEQTDANLAIAGKDADLMQKNRALGLSGLSDIYSDANRTGADYLNIGNSAANARRGGKIAWTKLGLDAVTGN